MNEAVIETHVDRKSAAFQQNSRAMVERLTQIKNEEEKIREAGGTKAVEGQHKKNRLTARERIAKLIDPRTGFFELGIYAAWEMYQEWGGAPAAGTKPPHQIEHRHDALTVVRAPSERADCPGATIDTLLMPYLASPLSPTSPGAISAIST